MRKMILSSLALIFCIGLFAQQKQSANSYYLSKQVEGTIDSTITNLKGLLKEYGFGIVTEIDMQKSMKEKLNADIKPYRIYGVCNVKLAQQLLQIDENIGVVLPCKMVLKQNTANQVEVVFINPIPLMQIINNKEVEAIAQKVKISFEEILQKI